MCGVVVSCAPGPVERKMIGLVEKFDLWDYNGDGFLVSSELDEAERVGGVDRSEIIKFYDQDNDQRISLKETSRGIERVDEAKEIVEEEAPAQ